jgi:hypothetical protein
MNSEQEVMSAVFIKSPEYVPLFLQVQCVSMLHLIHLCYITICVCGTPPTSKSCNFHIELTWLFCGFPII